MALIFRIVGVAICVIGMCVCESAFIKTNFVVTLLGVIMAIIGLLMFARPDFLFYAWTMFGG